MASVVGREQGEEEPLHAVFSLLSQGSSTIGGSGRSTVLMELLRHFEKSCVDSGGHSALRFDMSSSPSQRLSSKTHKHVEHHRFLLPVEREMLKSFSPYKKKSVEEQTTMVSDESSPPSSIIQIPARFQNIPDAKKRGITQYQSFSSIALGDIAVFVISGHEGRKDFERFVDGPHSGESRRFKENATLAYTHGIKYYLVIVTYLDLSGKTPGGPSAHGAGERVDDVCSSAAFARFSDIKQKLQVFFKKVGIGASKTTKGNLLIVPACGATVNTSILGEDGFSVPKREEEEVFLHGKSTGPALNVTKPIPRDHPWCSWYKKGFETVMGEVKQTSTTASRDVNTADSPDCDSGPSVLEALKTLAAKWLDEQNAKLWSQLLQPARDDTSLFPPPIFLPYPALGTPEQMLNMNM